MQCPGCQGEVLGWHFYCPACRTQLRWTTGTSLTAYEIGKPEPSKPLPSRKLPVILTAAAVSSAALAIIVIGVSLSQWNAARHQSLSQNAALLTEPVALAEAVVNRPVARAISATSEKRAEEKTSRSLSTERALREPEKPLARSETSERNAQSDVAAAPQRTAPKAAPIETVKSVEIYAEPLDATFDPRAGLLTIKSDTRARIYINGQFSGVTPRTIRLLAGEHSITLSADGCDEWSRKIQLPGRQHINIVAPLSKKAAPGLPDSNR